MIIANVYLIKESTIHMHRNYRLVICTSFQVILVMEIVVDLLVAVGVMTYVLAMETAVQIIPLTVEVEVVQVGGKSYSALNHAYQNVFKALRMSF